MHWEFYILGLYIFQFDFCIPVLLLFFVWFEINNLEVLAFHH